MAKSKPKSTKKTNDQTELMDAEYLQLCIDTQFDRGVSLLGRIITFGAEIESGHWEYLDSALTLLESLSDKPITVRINSCGGSVYEAAAMVGRMRSSSCEVNTEGYGSIMSAAVMLFAAGKHRKLSKYSWVMVHECSYGVEDKHSATKVFVEHIERERHAWAQWMEELTGTPKSKWLELDENGKDNYFTAQEALELRLADELI